MKNVPGTAIDRRTFITLSAATAGLVLYPDTLLFGQTSTGITANQISTASQAAASPAATKPAQRPDPLKPELVKEFVIAAHVDLDKTKALLTETPALLNATWDWGAGDFEMAIGGAGHMGRRDIALFLISQGSAARSDAVKHIGHSERCRLSGVVAAVPLRIVAAGRPTSVGR